VCVGEVIAGGGRSDLDGLLTGAAGVCGEWAVKDIDCWAGEARDSGQILLALAQLSCGGRAGGKSADCHDLKGANRDGGAGRRGRTRGAAISY
jgi:hypothetical protein